MRRYNLIKLSSLLTILVSAISCYQGQADEAKDSEPSLTSISFIHIFEKPEILYIAFIYSSSCPACLSCFDVINYHNKIEPFTCYTIKFEEVYNRQKVSNLGVSKIEDINVYSVPCLFKIENKTIVEERFGFTSIQSYILNLEN